LGKPGHLRRDLTGAMRTNTVSLDAKRGSCSVFFNRGIISTQAIARNLPKARSGLPSSGALQERIQDPEDSIRARLMAGLTRGVLTLPERAKEEGGKCYCALYELSDQELIDHLKALGKSRLEIVLSNAGEDTEGGSGDGDSTNQEAREALHDLKIAVTGRM